MKSYLLITHLFLASLTCLWAGDSAPQVAKAHLLNLLTPDPAALAESYADEVTLMPGHELLKPRYGVADDPSRGTATQVKQEQIVAALVAQLGGRKIPAPEKVAAEIKPFTFRDLGAEPGDYVVAPADPVATPDGKLHFSVKKGDVVIKAAPPKGDFVLFQLRQIDGKWRVVAEYLD